MKFLILQAESTSSAEGKGNHTSSYLSCTHIYKHTHVTYCVFLFCSSILRIRNRKDRWVFAFHVILGRFCFVWLEIQAGMRLFGFMELVCVSFFPFFFIN
ncbi:hypothetical protein NC652_012834 [Populus alba x Populus x berolinensis]|nr:hypothetical protein NC652_012834 [Populus alba x Populus x berolinensis]